MGTVRGAVVGTAAERQGQKGRGSATASRDQRLALAENLLSEAVS
jgi:hypothetical protein